MLAKIKEGFGLGIGIALGATLIQGTFSLISFVIMMLLRR